MFGLEQGSCAEISGKGAQTSVRNKGVRHPRGEGGVAERNEFHAALLRFGFIESAIFVCADASDEACVASQGGNTRQRVAGRTTVAALKGEGF